MTAESAVSGIRPDAVVGGRYRLLHARAQRPHSVLWRGIDDVLSRPVAVRIVPLDGPQDPRLPGLRAAAAAAGRVADARVARLLDIGEVAADGGPAAVFVVCEWVDGPSLTAVLRDGPLPGPEAADVAFQVARALSAAEDAGTAHGRLHPGNVLIRPDGAVKVTDLRVGAVLAGDGAADLAALGALVYASTTGCWPGPAGPALPDAPTADGRLCRPRQVRAGVPRELDVLAMRLLDGRPGAGRAVETPARATELLAGLPRRSYGTVVEDEGRGSPAGAGAGRWLRAGLRVAPWVALAALGVVGYWVGTAVGRVPGPAARVPSFSPPVGGGAAPSSLHALRFTLRDFDPEGDGHEDAADVPLATDSDPTTAWQTDQYRGNPRFGGLKNGVGLLADLGTARAVREARVLFTRPGADVQLLASATPPVDASAMTVVAQAVDTSQSVRLDPVAPPSDRYWLLWITRLPPAGHDTYQEGVAELALYG